MSPPCPVATYIGLIGIGISFDSMGGSETDCLAILADRHRPVMLSVWHTPQGLEICSTADCQGDSVIFKTDLGTDGRVEGTLPALAPGTYFFLDPVHPVSGRGTLYVVPPGPLVASIIDGSSPLGTDLARMLGLELRPSFESSLPCRAFIEVNDSGEGYCIEGLGNSDAERLLIGHALAGRRD